jgi:hypothetical protein
MFNLLEQMAAKSGCSEEAWELLLEFASAERAIIEECGQKLPHEAKDGPSFLAYEMPAEAMLRCMTRASDFDEDEWDALDDGNLCFTDIPVPDPLGDLFVSGYDAMPKCGFRNDAFMTTGLDRATMAPTRDVEGDEESDEWYSSIFPDPFDPSERR